MIQSQHIQECVVGPCPADGAQGMNGRDARKSVGTISHGCDQLSDD